MNEENGGKVNERTIVKEKKTMFIVSQKKKKVLCL